MKQLIITSIFVLSLVRPAWKLLIRQLLIDVFLNYMFNQKTIWNNDIDKPRLLFYLFLSPLAWFSLTSIWEYPFAHFPHLKIWYELLLGFIFVASSLILNITWLPFFETQIILSAKSGINKISSITTLTTVLNTESKILALYNFLIENNIAEGSFEAFKALICGEKLKKEERMKWINTYGKYTNRQTLIELMMSIFPEFEKNVQHSIIISKIEDYFVDKDGNEVFANSKDLKSKEKIISDWYGNTSTNLKKFRKMLDNSNLFVDNV